MSDVFLYIYFIFKSTNILPYFAASTGMPEYTKHMPLDTLHVFHIYNIRLVYSTLYPFLVFQVVCK